MMLAQVVSGLAHVLFVLHAADMPVYQVSIKKTIQLNIAKILFKAGADPNKKIKRGNTIMPMIFYLNNDIGIKELIKYGALINEFYKYKEIIKEFMDPETCHYFIKVLAKRRWVYLKCVVLILGIHKRAVVTANHPDRLLEQGVFEEL